MIIPPEAIPYIERQRTNCRGGDVRAKYLRRIWEEFGEFDLILPPRSKAMAIADIGCGVGGMAAAMARYFDDAHIILIDRDESPARPFYGYRETACFYNSLTVAAWILREDADQRTNTTVVTHPADGRIPTEDESLDLIISTLAMGFHFPWTVYREEILRTLKPEGGMLILDVRRETGQLEGLLDDFHTCTVVHKKPKYQRLALRL